MSCIIADKICGCHAMVILISCIMYNTCQCQFPNELPRPYLLTRLHDMQEIHSPECVREK